MQTLRVDKHAGSDELELVSYETGYSQTHRVIKMTVSERTSFYTGCPHCSKMWVADLLLISQQKAFL